MSVRKRKGIHKKPWQVDYSDGQGSRRSKQFATKKEADAFAATAAVEVREGIHVADRATIKLKEAGEFWITSATAAGLERTTIAQYQQHLDLHIVPFLGDVLLSKITLPSIRVFEDRLRCEGRSGAMVRKVLASLSSLLGDAQERGLVARNVARDRRHRRSPEQRRKKLRVGVDIPTPAEIKAIVSAASGRWRPLLITAVFTGLRSSELRGLRWHHVDLEGSLVKVEQRADRWGTVGPTKTAAGVRTLPLPPIVVNTLREWKLRCPRRDTGRTDGDGKSISELHYVFPNGLGNSESHANIVKRGLWPALIAAGVCDVADEGKNIAARYKGLHALRHWYASWCLNRVADGGLGLPYKTVQTRMGHSTLAMTMDTYGHLFQDDGEVDAMAAGERALLA